MIYHFYYSILIKQFALWKSLSFRCNVYRPFPRYGRWNANVSCTVPKPNYFISFSRAISNESYSQSKLHWKWGFRKYSPLSHMIGRILGKAYYNRFGKRSQKCKISQLMIYLFRLSNKIEVVQQILIRFRWRHTSLNWSEPD